MALFSACLSMTATRPRGRPGGLFILLAGDRKQHLGCPSIRFLPFFVFARAAFDCLQDHYENALNDLLRKKQKGEKIERPKEPARTNVVNPMDALRQSVQASGGV
jgi:hypothetical protein